MTASTPSVLDLATDRALAYEAAALKWTCDESIKRLRFDDNGRASERSGMEFALLMVPDAETQQAVELTSRPKSLKGFPPVTSWLRLFHPDTRPWILIRDSGDVDAPDEPGHRFTFRGAFSRANGDDLREWEGVAWVNSRTGDLMRIDAMPASQPEMLAVLIDRRNARGVGINLFGFRFSVGPRAHGRRLAVSFEEQSGFWLPRTARFETFDAVSKHGERPLRAVVVSLSRCREFQP